ncbi:hypothetical protein [Kutzneria albida]|uniref:Uncharacterized protein n=1 Tax=Kutzneria albida DSM 43870 TaxID=1449976 RepID=W5WBH3_9PSEU|nr:hypothetical protein [Kutzneria albida]AHH98202.1 hypothetical protein KALB_4840 [Kutzneria albida DSM 43870]
MDVDTRVLAIDDGIRALAELGVTAVQTRSPVRINWSEIRDGHVWALIGCTHRTPTGHVFVEVFAGDTRTARYALTHAEQFLLTGMWTQWIGCWWPVEWATELQAWLDVRDELLAGA